jgi:predicted HTH domain antitoxin
MNLWYDHSRNHLRAEEKFMQVTIEIPDNIAALVGRNGRSIARELLEAFAVEGYRAERLSRGQVSELLGLSFWETEEFLRQRGAWLHYDLHDLERDRAALRSALTK